MLRQIGAGGIAGAVATLPMSAVIWGGKRAGFYHGSPAPEAVSGRLTRRLTGKRTGHKRRRHLLTLLSHVGFGSGAGALYGSTTELRPPSLWTGMLFGVAVWLISYKGWIPAVGLLPPPEDDERGHAATIAAAHVVYGGALGLVSQKLLPRTQSSTYE